MPASAVKCLQRHGAKMRIASRSPLRDPVPIAKLVFRRSWCELDTARSGPPGYVQAAAEQEAAVARCRSSVAAALDNSRAHAENRCERLEEGFVRERDRVAVAELALADWEAQLWEEQAMVGSNDRWTQCKFLRASMKSF